MYKINSTYTYGVISQNVQLLHQLTDHNLLRNKSNNKHHPEKHIITLVYSGVTQVLTGLFTGVLRCTFTHSNSLCLAVDLQRTEAFWEMELLEVNGG